MAAAKPHKLYSCPAPDLMSKPDLCSVKYTSTKQYLDVHSPASTATKRTRLVSNINP